VGKLAVKLCIGVGSGLGSGFRVQGSGFGFGVRGLGAGTGHVDLNGVSIVFLELGNTLYAA
jgi:hypothetical protein